MLKEARSFFGGATTKMNQGNIVPEISLLSDERAQGHLEEAINEVDSPDSYYQRMIDQAIQLSEQQSISKKYSRGNHLCTKYRKMIPNLKMNKSSQTCTICLQKFQKNKIIKQLPCKHILHRQCAKSWLKVNKSCPVCRLDLEEHFRRVQLEEGIKVEGKDQDS